MDPNPKTKLNPASGIQNTGLKNLKMFRAGLCADCNRHLLLSARERGPGPGGGHPGPLGPARSQPRLFRSALRGPAPSRPELL
jgi:hypothetical protein